MAPDRHSMTELHRATVDSTGANVTDGWLAAADGAGNVEFINPSTVGVTDHGALTGLADDDHSAYLKKIEGGQDTISAHGAMGATETLDPTAGNIHTGTLTADCTATISAPVGSGMSSLEFWVTQDGTGGWDLTMAATGGTVTDDGTITPDTTAGVTVRYILERVPGTTNDWVRNIVGGGSSLTIKDEGTPLATAATSLDFVGAGVVASGATAAKTITIAGVTAAAVSALGFVGAILISDTPSTPLVFADLIQNEAQDDLVYADV